jgi:hypothetical protein
LRIAAAFVTASPSAASFVVQTMSVAVDATLFVAATTLLEAAGAAALQQAAAPDVRARAASIAHACDMVLSTLMVPLAGFFSTRRPGRRAQ